MNKEILLKAATTHPDEIIEPYRSMFKLGGFEAIIALVELQGGSTVYVPSSRTIFSRCLEEAAKEEIGKMDSRALARKYGFSDRHMKRMLKH